MRIQQAGRSRHYAAYLRAALAEVGPILRLDAAWGWHGPEGRRLDLYLDGLL